MGGNIKRGDKGGRIAVLQSSRFAFVLLIYISHCVTPAIRSPFDFGGEGGVAFFFVLSGFVLSCGYGKRAAEGGMHTGRFVLRRMARLYPLHLLTLALTVALDHRLGVDYDAVQLAANIALVQTWIPSDHTLFVANGVSWFLCDMLFFYLVFQLMYRWLTAMPWRTVAWLAAATPALYATVAYMVDDSMVNCTLYSNPLLRSIDFALGILACRLYHEGGVRQRLERMKGKAAIVAALLAMAYCLYQHMSPAFRCAMLFWPIMPVVVMLLTSMDSDNDIASRCMKSRPMVWLGGISFEIYLCHLLAMRLTQHFMHMDGSVEDDLTYFALALVVTIIVSWAAARWFVGPVAAAINRAAGRRQHRKDD